MLRTVQQCLLEADTEKVLAAYHEALPINYEMIENKELTLRKIQERSDKRIAEFIEYMTTIPLATERTPAAFFAVPEIAEDSSYIKEMQKTVDKGSFKCLRKIQLTIFGRTLKYNTFSILAI